MGGEEKANIHCRRIEVNRKNRCAQVLSKASSTWDENSPNKLGNPGKVNAIPDNTSLPGNGSNTQGTSTTALSASLTPTSADLNNLLIGWCFIETGGNRTFTAQSGWTLREPPGTGNIAFQDKIVSSISAVTSTITISGANVAWSAGILAITDSAGFATIAVVPSVLTPPNGYGDVNKFGSFGTFCRADVPFGNATSGSNTSGVGQIFPTGFGTP